MFFDKIFKRKPHIKIETSPVIVSPKTYQQKTAPNKPEYNILVLWWVGEKKKGYDVSSKKFPKWFETSYGIKFDEILDEYLNKGFIKKDDSIVTITKEGKEELEKESYIVFLHNHCQYDLTTKDFTHAENFGKVSNNDIAWGIFNKRILEYSDSKMWKKLEHNYANMADLLIEEKRYNDALEFIFATVYLETSGMLDNNLLTPISTIFSNGKYKEEKHPNGMTNIHLLEISNYNVTAPFLKIQKSLNLNLCDLKGLFLSSKIILSLEQILPFRYFEKNESFLIFEQAILKGDQKGVFRLSDLESKLIFNFPNKNSSTYFYNSTENALKKR